MRTYHNPAGTPDIVVTTEKKQAPLRHVVRFTSGSMTWGGLDTPGGLDLAASILADYYEHEVGATRPVAEAKAAWLCGPFGLDFVSDFKDGWLIDSDEIKAWVANFPETVEESDKQPTEQ